jgi:glutamate racemase
MTLDLDTSVADHDTSAASSPELTETKLTTPTVGVFDSGIGGFTVASAILKRRPDLNLVYYADSINLPYGGRTRDQLTRYAHNTIEFLLEQGVEMIAVGCHSSNSALGAEDLTRYPVPVFDLVSSTLEPLAARTEVPEQLAILATEATINAGYWEQRLREALPDTEILPMAAPELVPIIEGDQSDDFLLRRALDKYIGALVERQAFDVLLGCTHYPLLKTLMLDRCIYLRPIDPGQLLADRLVASIAPAVPHAPEGRMTFFNSLPSERFYSMGERVFGRSIRELTRMYIVNPHED